MDPQWIQVFSNLGAVGILGAFVLKVLPQMVKDLAEAQAKAIDFFKTEGERDRESFADRQREQTAALVNAINNSCKYAGHVPTRGGTHSA